MKLLNIFKKKEKAAVKFANIKKIEKTQLEKVIGGGDKLWTDYNVHDPGITKK